MAFEPVESFHQANEQLLVLPDLIIDKTSEMEEAREKYLLAGEVYEQVYSRALLETKLRQPDMTGNEITATAKLLAHESRIAEIRAESTYRRLTNEVAALRDKLDSLREISYNLRRESQIR